MKYLVQKYCDDTTFHGFKELYYANSKLTKIFWAGILIFGLVMTVYQMYNVIENYTDYPIKTEISLLPKNVKPNYPPFTFVATHFYEWVDLKKVQEFNFDLGSFFYFMSYIYPIFTNFQFSVKEAEQKLTAIMKRQNFSNLYDAIMAISSPTPCMLISNHDFHRVFENGLFAYIQNVDQSKYNNLSSFQFVQTVILLNASDTFENTEFFGDFVSLFKYNLSNDYSFHVSAYMKSYGYNDGVIARKNANKILPRFINFNGDSTSLSLIDSYFYNYLIHLSATYYRWLSTNDKPCNDQLGFHFEVDCRRICSSKFKLVSVKSCNVYSIPEHQNEINLANATNLCTINYQLFQGGNQSFSYADSLQCVTECSSSCNKWNFESKQTSYLRRSSLIDEPITEVGHVSVVNYKIENILQVSQEPIASWNEALGNIGGLLGLWLGGSLLSFVQLIYMFLCVPLETRLKHRNAANDLQKVEIVENRK